MTERSMFWDGSVLGDCGPYSQAHLMDRFFRALLNGTGDRGVLYGWLNELEVTGTSSPLSVNTGAGIVYGMFYETDAAVAVTIPLPASGYSRYDRIVLRRDWGAQTVRIWRVAGTPSLMGTSTIPALTQTAGSIYEIPLATVLIQDDGALTLTDTREFCQFSIAWAANTADTDQFGAGSVTTDKIPDRTRYFIKDAGTMEPDSANAATWVAGASYDYWEFADAVTDAVWVYTTVPDTIVGTTLTANLWSVPDVNGAGGGAENVRWDYNYAIVPVETVAAFTTGNITVDQQARVNTTVYQDTLIAMTGCYAGDLVILQILRLGGDAADSYASDMRLLGVEFTWTNNA